MYFGNVHSIIYLCTYACLDLHVYTCVHVCVILLQHDQQVALSYPECENEEPVDTTTSSPEVRGVEYIKRPVGIYMRIPMYSMMGGAPVGCSQRIKGGVPGRAIVKFFTFLYYGR